MTIELKVPSAGESITEVIVAEWLKAEGAHTERDEPLALIETDKANVEVTAPVAGRLAKILKQAGASARVGEVIGILEEGEAATEAPAKAEAEASSEAEAPKQAARSAAPPAGEAKKRAPAKSSEAAEPEAKAPKSAKAGASEAKSETASASAARPSAATDASAVKSAKAGASAAKSEASSAVGTRISPSKRRALREAEHDDDDAQAQGNGHAAAQAGDAERADDAAAKPATAKAAAVAAKPATTAPAPAAAKPAPAPAAKPATPSSPAPAKAPAPASAPGSRHDEVVAMSPLRKRVAERLVHAQQTAAMLTTFNEIDLSAVIALRKEHQEAFKQKHNTKLGFMSFFIKASIEALRAFPAINAEIKDDTQEVVYHHYYDIGVAVGGGKGLVVPIIRNAETKSFADLEKTIADFGERAKTGRLKLDELQGGTFTISNGGVYGSMMSTPILNPPQSGILGMHAIQDRAVARNGTVAIAPMMYVALTYDHRIVDGREAVSFLVRIKECVENPARMLLEV